MGTKHESSSEQISGKKKPRRARFSEIDTGIEPSQCVKIYLASSRNEVDSPDCYRIEPVDLSHFFEEDGKIYGYEGLKITVWLSSVSFHAYADISFTRSSNGAKGITDLKSSLQAIFADNLVEKKDDFLETFSTDCHYVKSLVSSAEEIQISSSGSSHNAEDHPEEDSNVIKVLRVSGNSVGPLYCRVIPLVLLLVDGSNPIEVTDPRWDMYILVQIGQHNDAPAKLLGFAAVYRFYRYPDSFRLRLGQILIMPPHQRKGFGRQLVEALYAVAVSTDAYDLTVEEPVDALQHVRTLIDVNRLLDFDPICPELDRIVSKLKGDQIPEPRHMRPQPSIAEQVRKSLKINKRQFLQCWEILVYLQLGPVEEHVEKFEAVVGARVKADVAGKVCEVEKKRVVDVPTEFEQEMSFFMFKCKGGEGLVVKEEEEDGTKQEEVLGQLVEERLKQIRAVASKVSVVGKSI